MVERQTGKQVHTKTFSQRYFHSIIIIAALLATLVVIIILSSNEKPLSTAIKPVQSVEENRLAELNSALENDSDNITLNLEMGNQLFDLGNYREAVVYYRRVLEKDTKNIAARIDLGVCYFNLGITDSALTEMQQSLKIDPNHVKGLFNIGVIYYNMGENAQARNYWETLIRQHENTQEAQIARQMLENIKT